MNEFDQFVKHELKVKHYARYTDDFLIISDNLNYLKGLLPLLENFLENSLYLSLHPKKIEIRKYSQGIDFLGYVILPHCQLVRKRTWKRICRKFDSKIEEYKLGLISKESLNQSLQSYLGVLSHANTYKLQEYLKNKYWLD